MDWPSREARTDLDRKGSGTVVSAADLESAAARAAISAEESVAYPIICPIAFDIRSSILDPGESNNVRFEGADYAEIVRRRAMRF